MYKPITSISKSDPEHIRNNRTSDEGIEMDIVGYEFNANKEPNNRVMDTSDIDSKETAIFFMLTKMKMLKLGSTKG